MSISCNGVDISAKDKVKYLGVTIDQDMSGSSMGNFVVQNVNSKIKFLYRKGSLLGFKKKEMLYSAMIQYSYDYACNSWYRGLKKQVKHKLQTSQNKAIRLILGYHSRQHLSCL